MKSKKQCRRQNNKSKKMRQNKMKGGGEEEKELFKACINNNVKKAIALMDKGASIHAKNGYKRTPLHEVCIEGNVELAC